MITEINARLENGNVNIALRKRIQTLPVKASKRRSLLESKATPRWQQKTFVTHPKRATAF